MFVNIALWEEGLICQVVLSGVEVISVLQKRNKAIAQRYIKDDQCQQLWGTRELLTPDFVDHADVVARCSRLEWKGWNRPIRYQEMAFPMCDLRSISWLPKAIRSP